MRISSTNQSRFERYAHSEMRKVSSSYPFLNQMIDRIKLDPFRFHMPTPVSKILLLVLLLLLLYHRFVLSKISWHFTIADMGF